MESSPHCPAISSQLQKPVNLTNSTPLILSHSVSSLPLKFHSSLFQSTTDSFLDLSIKALLHSCTSHGSPLSILLLTLALKAPCLTMPPVDHSASGF